MPFVEDEEALEKAFLEPFHEGVDTFGNWEESSEWMRTSSQFAANPHGTLIDPEQLEVAHQAGASFRDLHRRAYNGEFPPAVPPSIRMLPEDSHAPTER